MQGMQHVGSEDEKALHRIQCLHRRRSILASYTKSCRTALSIVPCLGSPAANYQGIGRFSDCDGIFGNHTMLAMNQFQMDIMEPITDKINPSTWKFLFNVTKDLS